MVLMAKLVCVLLYATAAASLVVDLPDGIGWWARAATVLFLAAHLAEAALFFRHVRKYRGPVAVSVLLTLLFGLFHWVPLMTGKR